MVVHSELFANVRFDDLNHDVKLDRLTCAHNCNRALEEEQVRSVLSSYRSRDNLRD